MFGEPENGPAAAWISSARFSAAPAGPAFLFIVALCFFASPYGGIEGDALIYMARAVADLDPAGVGRDIMFTDDGQAGFTVFRIIAARLTAVVGLRATAESLAVINVLAWCGAVAAFSGLFVEGRARGLLVLCAGLLPSFYACFPVWEARDFVATPRPLSEACVLLALAALGSGRGLPAALLLAAAASLHPIMALPGLAVTLLLLGLRDRRWFALAGVVLVGAVIAAALGTPVFARLAVLVDAEWLAMLRARSPYLFLSQWSPQTLAPLSVQVVTIVIGAGLCRGFARAALLAVLAVAAVGVAVAWVFGDLVPVLLVVQAQPWRALWLVSAAAMPMAGFCVLHLIRRGSLGRIAAACLALAWLSFDAVPATPLAAGLALGLARAAGSQRPVLSRGLEPAILALLAALAAFAKGQKLYAVATFAGDHFAASDLFGLVMRVGIPALVLLPIATLWAARRGRGVRPLTVSLLLVVLFGGVVLTWDRRAEATRRIEANVHDPALVALTASHSGEVLWLGNDDEWYWLGRPQWNSMVQGASIVFSRSLAAHWHERAAFLTGLGLLGPERLQASRVPGPIIVPRLTKTAAAAICARPDAPAWIVAPLPAGSNDADGPQGTLWRAPVTETMSGLVDDQPHWISFSTYNVVACSPVADPQR